MLQRLSIPSIVYRLLLHTVQTADSNPIQFKLFIPTSCSVFTQLKHFGYLTSNSLTTMSNRKAEPAIDIGTIDFSQSTIDRLTMLSMDSVYDSLLCHIIQHVLVGGDAGKKSFSTSLGCASLNSHGTWKCQYRIIRYISDRNHCCHAV